MSEEDENGDEEELSPRERMKKMMEGGEEGEGPPGMGGGMGGMMGGMMGGGMPPGMGGMGPGGPGGRDEGNERLAKEMEELRVEVVKVRQALERIADAVEE